MRALNSWFRRWIFRHSSGLAGAGGAVQIARAVDGMEGRVRLLHATVDGVCIAHCYLLQEEVGHTGLKTIDLKTLEIGVGRTIGRFWLVADLGVESDYRGRGIATALWNDAELAILAEPPSGRDIVIVRVPSERATRFWAKMGFNVAQSRGYGIFAWKLVANLAPDENSGLPHWT